MAWIVKNSAGTQIDRRDEPYLSNDFKADFEANIITRYPTRRAATLPLLHAIQDQNNWVPLQAIEEAADFLGLKAAEVLDTASFYEMYALQPKGKYLIKVCQSISCELLGHDKLIEALENKLGIHVGETTADGKFTLHDAECLGACGGAPCGMVNDRLLENLTIENLDRIIDSCE